MEIVAEEPVFEAGLLAAGESEPADVRRQLSRWTKRGNCALSCQGERISAMLWLLSYPNAKRAYPFGTIDKHK